MIKIVDGTNLSMPDTPQNQAAWPQPSSQKPGCGFPMMKLVSLFSLASGALLGFATGTLHIHESQLFRALWDCLRPGEILLSDRGFCSFFAMASLLRRGIDTVMRLHQARRADFRKGKALGKDDILVRWKKPAQRSAAWSREEFDALPQDLTLRMIRLEVSVKGFCSRSIVIVTTLLDPIAYPADALRALYFERWGVELHFREIKILLRMDNSSPKTNYPSGPAGSNHGPKNAARKTITCSQNPAGKCKIRPIETVLNPAYLSAIRI